MFLSLIRKRRSIRIYLDKAIEQDQIDQLIEAALRSPSSRSLNPWEFVVVTDKGILQDLSECKPHGAAFLKGAPLGIVVLADPEKCDVWIEDTAIASTYIQLQAESMGLGSCWIQIRKRAYDETTPAEARVRERLGIPENRVVASIIAVGHPDETKEGHPKDTLLYHKVSYNRYAG